MIQVSEEPHHLLSRVEAACRAERRLQLTEWEAYAILRQWHIPVAPCRLVSSPEEAALAANSLGGPVAVKIVSPDIGHKTEAGCVRLGLDTPEAASAACAEVLANARYHQKGARIHGVLVQKMAPSGVEVIAGALQDPSFGPVIMTGLGGIFTEVIKDVSFRLAPVEAAEAETMLKELAGFPLLAGARGRPPVDLPALAQVLVSLGQLAAAWPALKELDLNPLITWESGVFAVDALATLQA